MNARDAERAKKKIEAAALKTFIHQGYHGTSMRDIARASGYSIGNIYNHYETKEHIYVSLIKHFEARMAAKRSELVGNMSDIFDPAELERLAWAVHDIVFSMPDYWRLMYIDVVEFRNRHFAGTFHQFSKKVEAALGERLKLSTQKGSWRGIDPALAISSIYLQFFTYFLLQKVFNVKEPLGTSDRKAVTQIIRMMTQGLWQDFQGKA
ncbi:MAG TPA: TetR/AcrR family transcriptional regulator [Terriglobales bacterium]|nr:TetR/AcrR family transcriptional regulator [Terriglobales bacterium]